MGYPNYNLVVPRTARIDETCRMCINVFVGHNEKELTDEDVNELVTSVNAGLCSPLGGRAITGCSEMGHVQCGVAMSSPEPRTALTREEDLRDQVFEKILNNK